MEEGNDDNLVQSCSFSIILLDVLDNIKDFLLNNHLTLSAMIYPLWTVYSFLCTTKTDNHKKGQQIQTHLNLKSPKGKKGTKKIFCSAEAFYSSFL